MRAVVAVYAVAVGVLMAAWWVGELRGGVLDRGDRARSELALHLAAELLTAGWLIVAGVLVLAVGGGAVPFLVAGLGMLLYTVINSPGYFVARREVPVVVMFGVLVVCTVVGLVIVLV